MKKVVSIVLVMALLVGMEGSVLAQNGEHCYNESIEVEEILALSAGMGDTEINSSKEYFVTEKGETKSESIDVKSTIPQWRQPLKIAVVAAISVMAFPIGASATILSSALAIGEAMYNFNYDGKLIISSTQYTRYSVKMLTGKKTVVSRYTIVELQGWARRDNGYELVRSYTHTLRHK